MELLHLKGDDIRGMKLYRNFSEDLNSIHSVSNVCMSLKWCFIRLDENDGKEY